MSKNTAHKTDTLLKTKKLFSANKKIIIGVAIALGVIIGGIFAFPHISKSPIFYKNKSNTYSVVFPMKHQTVGGNLLQITFDRKIDKNYFKSDIDIWINGEHEYGNVEEGSENSKVRSVIKAYQGYSIYFHKDKLKDGDVIKISAKHHNKLQAEEYGKDGVYVNAERSWVYKDITLPKIKNITKGTLKHPLRPEYKMTLFDAVREESVITDNFAIYTGKGEKEGSANICLGPKNKVRTNIRLNAEKNTAIIAVKKDIRRKKDPTCIYIVKNHVSDNKWRNPIDMIFFEDAKEASIEIAEIFNPENNFYSNLHINFNTPMFLDAEEKEDIEAFIAYRKKQKEALAKNIVTDPEAEIDIENIYFTPKKAIVPIKLKEETQYSITLNPIKDVFGEKTKEQTIGIDTGKQEYLGIKFKEQQSVFPNTESPRFLFVQYANPKAEIKLCRIAMAEYGIIENMYKYRKNLEQSDYFFKKGIDLMATEECFSKTIEANEDEYTAEFGIDDLIGDPGRSGLYFMTFENEFERKIDSGHSLQYPLFFSVVDSHITMKISKNGKAFFWANDFKYGNGVPNLTIQAYKSN